MSNKTSRERWSASNLVKIAEYIGSKLSFILPDGERVVIAADGPGEGTREESEEAVGARLPLQIIPRNKKNYDQWGDSMSNLVFEVNHRYYFWDRKRSRVGEVLVTSLDGRLMTFVYLGKSYTCERSYAARKLYNSEHEVHPPYEQPDDYEPDDDDDYDPAYYRKYYEESYSIGFFDDEFDDCEYLYGESDRLEDCYRRLENDSV